jgi:hypothetical protein
MTLSGKSGIPTPALILGLLAVFFLLFAATVGKDRLPGGFICDEAAYFMMTQSLWEDGDLRWEERDVVSANRIFEGGPRNVILMTPDGGENLYYGKPYIYSLLVLPFFALLGVNGFVLVNALMFITMVWLAWRYLGAWNSSGMALLMAVTFFFLSAAFPYVFWMHPEVFNMFVIFLGCYFWIHPGPAGKDSFFNRPVVRAGLAGLFFALAAFSKFPHAAFGGFFALHGLVTRRWSRLMALGLIFAAGFGLLVLGQLALSDAPSVYHVARCAIPRVDSVERLAGVADLLLGEDPRGAGEYGGGGLGLFNIDGKFPYNLVYYFVGRHTGLVPYFFPAVLALYWFLFRGGRKLGLDRWALLAAAAVLIGFYILVLSFNDHGGGGFIGNRYFVSFYPAFLFLIGRIPSLTGVVAGWVVAGLFLSQLLFTPFGANTSRQSLQAHVRNPVFRVLPFETTLRWIPSYIDQVRGYEKGTIMYRNRFLDLNAYPESDSFWVRGKSRTAVLVMSRKPLERIIFRCSSRDLEAWCRGSQGEFRTVKLRRFEDGGPAEGVEEEQLQVVLENPKPRAVHPFGGEEFTSWFYVVKFKTDRGFIPKFSEPGSTDIRYLGVKLTLLGEGEPYIGDEFFRYRLQEIQLPETVAAGAELEVPLRLQSRSPYAWDEKVRFSYHWMTTATEGGKPQPVVWDGVHTALPGGRLGPGETADAVMQVRAPDSPGRYLLQVDLLCDGVNWFANHNRWTPVAEAEVLVGTGEDGIDE